MAILTFLIAIITERVIEPRLGKYQPADGDDHQPEVDPAQAAAESRGLTWALVALIGVFAVFGLLTIPARRPPAKP